MSAECAGHEPRSRSRRALAAAFALTAAVFALELVGGFWSGSLALMADAAHMALDLAALGLGLFASWAAGLPADPRRTYGYRRVEVLAALANGIGLWVTVGVLLHEAWERMGAPVAVRVPEMLAIASAGFVCNAVSGLLLYRSSRQNLNLRAVFLHVISDLLGSAGAIAAGVVMGVTGSTRADPVATAFICMIICAAAYRLVRDSIHILLEGTPARLDPAAIRAELGRLPGVVEVHDLHLWTISSGMDSMSGHIVVARPEESQATLKAASALLKERFAIEHSTIQIELRT